MIKILHLLSEHKFVSAHIFNFEQASFANKYVFITEHGEYKGAAADRLQQVSPFSADFNSLPGIIADFDIVIVYNLDYLKSYLVNRINSNVIVMWHFYGTELYNELPAFKFNIYSQKTKQLIGVSKVTIAFNKLKRLASRIKHSVLQKTPTYTEIADAMKRVNYFICLSKEEYDYIQANCPFQLPSFLKLPVYMKDAVQQVFAPKKNNCLQLGHAGTPDANHRDIIDLLIKAKYTGRIIVPLSYGESPKYILSIKKVLKESGLHVEILDRFLPLEVYSEKMNTCQASVFNAYRQIGGSNIFLALKNHSKVYLNERSPLYLWLINIGFQIFSVQRHLENDLKDGQLALLPDQAMQNAIAYSKMTTQENNDLFLEQLTQIGIKKRGTVSNNN